MKKRIKIYNKNQLIKLKNVMNQRNNIIFQKKDVNNKNKL